MKSHEQIAKEFTDRDYSIHIETEYTKSGKTIKAWCAHDSWWTNDLYQAKPLPSFQGKDLNEIFRKLDKYLNG